MRNMSRKREERNMEGIPGGKVINIKREIGEEDGWDARRRKNERSKYGDSKRRRECQP